MATLEYQLVWQDAPGGAPRIYPLKGDDLRMGRSSRCDVVVIHPETSRVHARLIRREDGYWVEDLASTNGTWLNGRRLKPHQPVALRSGDIIGLGPNVLLHYHVVAVEPEPPAHEEELALEEHAMWGPPPWEAGAQPETEAEPKDEAAEEEGSWGPMPWVAEERPQEEEHEGEAESSAEPEPEPPSPEFEAEAPEGEDEEAPSPSAPRVSRTVDVHEIEEELDAVEKTLASDEMPAWALDEESAEAAAVAFADWSVEEPASPESEDLVQVASEPAPSSAPRLEGVAAEDVPEAAAVADVAEEGAETIADEAPAPRRRSFWLSGCLFLALVALCAMTVFVWWVETNHLWCAFFSWVPFFACP